MAAKKENDDATADMEAFLRAAKYTLVKFTDMNAEMKEESMDICITAVEKFPTEMEKCTQVGRPVLYSPWPGRMQSSSRMYFFAWHDAHGLCDGRR